MRPRFNVALGLVALAATLLAPSFGLAVSSPATVPPRGRCEALTIPLCRDNGLYNETVMPNLLNHRNQDDAGLEAHQFFPLVKVKCSPDLKFFLCLLYAPPCSSTLEDPIPPCRSLCTSARLGCEPVLNRFNFAWPENFECGRFPDGGPGELCVGGNVTWPRITDVPAAPNSTGASDVSLSP